MYNEHNYLTSKINKKKIELIYSEKGFNIMADVMNSDIGVSGFELQLRCWISTQGKAWNLLPSSYGLNSTTTIPRQGLIWH